MASIDSKTKDYLVGGNGDNVADNLETLVYLRLSVKKGSYWADPFLGSDLHKIKKITQSAPLEAARYALNALSDLVAGGIIRDLTAVAAPVDDNRHGLLIVISCVDAFGRPRTFEHFQPVGD